MLGCVSCTNVHCAVHHTNPAQHGTRTLQPLRLLKYLNYISLTLLKFIKYAIPQHTYTQSHHRTKANPFLILLLAEARVNEMFIYNLFLAKWKLHQCLFGYHILWSIQNIGVFFCIINLKKIYAV